MRKIEDVVKDLLTHSNEYGELLNNGDTNPLIQELQAITGWEAPVNPNALSYEDIEIGQTYRIINFDGITKKILTGKLVTITGKDKSELVTGELLERAGKHPAGTKIALWPEGLEAHD